MNSKTLDHLCKDKVMAGIIRRTGKISLKRETDLYLALLRAIVGQQLSVKAAATNWKRFLDLFNSGYPHPDLVLSMDVQVMRNAGLSFQKAGYLKNIAEFSQSSSLDYKNLKRMEDEELIEYLCSIKGVGRWTAEMILMFTLRRPDVLPLDDLGIQISMRQQYKLRHKDKKRLYAAMTRLAERWRPYRTLACMYLWKSKDLASGIKS